MAKDTTLGADNGIAVAMILAIIEDKTIKHGPLEILITSNEENGMVGITKFDINKLRCKYMINLDSESDSEISIGCPGNIDVVFSLPFTRETAPIANTTNLKLVIKGGIGGHSGLTISQKRINAIKQIFDTLTLIDQNFDIRLIDVEKTGVAKNVIPSECAVNICVQSKDVESIKAIVKKEYLNIKQEYLLEKELTLDVTKSNTTSLPMTKNTSKVSIGSIANLFNGV
jgi:dipeptidase D